MKRFLFGLIFAFLFIVPIVSLAQIVPCDGVNCQTCDFVKLGNNLVTWLIGAMVSICAIAIVVGGLRMVTAGGDTGALESAKGLIKNAVIGFIILLAAWLIIDTILKVLLQGSANGTDAAQIEGYGPWNGISCTAQPTVTTGPGVQGAAGSGTQGTVVAGGGCTTSCTTVPTGITVKSGACSGGSACTVSSVISGNLTTLDQKLDAAGLNWQVTEAFPPTVPHQNPCHQNGTCIDAGFTAGTPPTAANISTFITNAGTSGMRAVWEVKTKEERDALVSGGVPTGNIQVVSAITAPHFSVYKQ
jgi:hypothetical protein